MTIIGSGYVPKTMVDEQLLCRSEPIPFVKTMRGAKITYQRLRVLRFNSTHNCGTRRIGHT